MNAVANEPIRREIDRFEAFVKRLPANLRAERLCEYGIALGGKDGATFGAGKDIGLTIMGLTHGNEWAGAGVVNELMSHLAAGLIKLPFPVAFILGNPWAALENRRFIERDLNRCFARQNPTAREELRAKDLMPVLARTAFLVDYHQTSRETDRAFFIFPYAEPSFGFARLIAPRLTVVTHWGKPFSTEGMCTDEFVNSKGGVGLSLEVGQNSLDPYHVAVGVDAGLWAMQRAAALLEGREAVVSAFAPEPEIYTWAEIVPWPESGVVEMAPVWRNFREVAVGDLLATVGGRPLVARTAGKMLFPKFLSADQQAALESRPTELCRILRRIGLSDLPS